LENIKNVVDEIIIVDEGRYAIEFVKKKFSWKKYVETYQII